MTNAIKLHNRWVALLLWQIKGHCLIINITGLQVPARGVKRHITESAKMWRISLQLLCYSMRGSEGEWDKPAKSPSRSMNCACSTQIAVRQNKPQQSKLLWWRFLNFRILLSLTPYFGIYSLKWAPKILLLLSPVCSKYVLPYTVTSRLEIFITVFNCIIWYFVSFSNARLQTDFF